jgi:hypothetical protein
VTALRRTLVALLAVTLLGSLTAYANSLTIEAQTLTTDGDAVSVPEQGLALALAASGGVVNTARTATATLTGGTAQASGQLVFTLHTGATCAGTVVGTSTKAVTSADDDQVVSDGVTPTTTGDHSWRATYGNDPVNDDATSNCVAITVTAAAPTLTCGAAFVSPTPATATAGTAFSVRVRAQKPDAAGTTCVDDTTFAGSKTLAWSGGTTSPAPTSKAPDRPVDGAVSFTAGEATVSGWRLYFAGSNTIGVTTSGVTTSTSITVTAGASALAFSQSTVAGSSVVCRSNVAVQILENNQVFTTKVKAGQDSWSNPVTVAGSGTVNVTMTLATTPSAPNAPFNNISGTGLSINMANADKTSSGSFSAQRRNASAFTGSLTASASGFVSAVCLLEDPS